MKKFLTVILAALVLTCGAACGTETGTGTVSGNDTTSSSTRGPVGNNSSSAEEESEAESKEESKAESEEESEAESKSSKQYSSMDEFINSDEAAASLEAMQEQYADTMVLEILAEDNKLVYQCTYTEQLPEESLETTKETFDILMDSVSATNAQLLEEIKNHVDVEDPVIVYRYLNADETLIYEYEFDEDTEVTSDSLDDYMNIESVEDYLNLPSIQESIEMTKEQYEDTAEVNVIAEDNKLIYEFTFDVQFDESTASDFATELDAQIESYNDTYCYIAQTLDSLLGTDDTVVIVRYNNADGSVIWEKEFTAQ